MATQVLVAHTGQRLQADSRQFASLDEFKDWVAQRSKIPLQSMIALTPQGRGVKLQSIHIEREILVYDLRVSQRPSPNAASSSSIPHEIPLPKPYSVPVAPDSLEQVRSVASWQNLFRERREWALAVAQDGGHMSEAVQERYSEMDVMIKCMDAAVTNIEISVKGIETRYGELKRWTSTHLPEYEQLVADSDRYLTLARNIPIEPAMISFMTGDGPNSGGEDHDHPQQHQSGTLETLLSVETARRAAGLAPAALRKLARQADELDAARDQMVAGLAGLIRDIEKVMARSVMAHSADSTTLLQDMETIARKIDADYTITLGYAAAADIPQASRIAETHTNKLIPKLAERLGDMDATLRYATRARNAIAADAADLMAGVSEITALHNKVKTTMAALGSDEEDLTSFDYLRLTREVPYMYASFVSESIRRREWTEKVKLDSSTIINEMAAFQDEEARRRKKWQKTVGETYGPGLDTNPVGLEVNLMGEDAGWPTMERRDLEQYVEAVQGHGFDPKVVDDIQKLLVELTTPTKKQARRIRAFRNGSVHEAAAGAGALGRSGLLIRGDEDLVRSLQDDKSKLEDRLKTADSRVRRLEGLLHREQAAKQAAEYVARQGGGLPHSPGGASIGAGVGGPRDSVAGESSVVRSGGKPAGAASEMVALQQRLDQVEAELRTERQRATTFEEDLGARANHHDTIRGQIEEANSTKRDLLENMEAQQREFMEVRRSLEEEVRTLRSRLEDADDELEHFGESRENEKATYDERVRELEDDRLKMQGQVEFLRNESRLQREAADVTERELRESREEAQSLGRELAEARDSAEARLGAMRDLHAQLQMAHASCSAPTPPATADLADDDLVEALSSTAAAIASRAQVAESDVSLLRSNLARAEESLDELRSEIEQARDRLAAEETESRHLRESIGEERAKVVALESELQDERAELGELRVRIADGETGSETLRHQLEEGERKTTAMAEELASRQSQVGSLEEELRLFRERLQEAQAKLGDQTARLGARTRKAGELTQVLYSQNDRLLRLLDRLGFSVTREAGSRMTIQRVPKAGRSMLLSMTEAASANFPKSQQIQPPSQSPPPPSSLPGRGLGDSADLELLYWTKQDSDGGGGGGGAAEDDRYRAFMDTLGSFDTDAFTDTIYRRVKEIEHTARKIQRDARAYRDRAHGLQREAHDKIAFRHFKEGDLALFLPTRNQQSGAWAAFNVGFPHYFLREQDSHRLRTREWLVARITRIQERVVDLSRSVQQQAPPSSEVSSLDGESTNTNTNNDNPFQLSDGLRWYLIDAHEDKPGAPSTPGAGKSTVAGSNVEAVASIQTHSAVAGGGGAMGGGKKQQLLGSRNSVHSIEGVSKTLSRSLESRRSSGASKKGLPFSIIGMPAAKNGGCSGGSGSGEPNSPRAAGPAAQPRPDTPSRASPSAPLSPSPLSPVAESNQSKQQQQQHNGQERVGAMTAEVRPSDMDHLLGPY